MKLHWTERACPMCGSTDDSDVFVEANIDPRQLDAFAFASRKLPEYMHPRLVECPNCGLLYANPSLSVDTLESAYEQASFDSAEAAVYASRTYTEYIRPLVPGLPGVSAALDIGAGEGAFVQRLFELGFDRAEGVEPSLAPVAAASPEIRKRIRQSLFRPEDFAPESFSLVTCFQTMEHVPHPLELARGVYSLLQPGGAFGIVVHNRRALSAKVMGTKSPIFDIEHLQLFCPDTARRLLEYAGFERVRVSTLWNRYPVRYWLRLLPLPKGLKGSLVGLSERSAVGGFPVPLPAGNIFCTGYRPK